MSIFVALGISIGVLAAVWAVVIFNIISALPAVFTGFTVPVTFIAWACFYAAGGKTEGLVKALCANITGLIYGVLVALLGLVILGSLPAMLGLGIGLLIFVFCMCAQAKVKQLSFIPGTVIGASVFFALGPALPGVTPTAVNTPIILPIVVAMVCGVILGLISEKWAGKMAKK